VRKANKSATARPAKAAAESGHQRGHVHNAEITDLFNRYAVLLEMQGANPFRVRAYHNAARTIENLPRDVNEMLGAGEDLTELPGIGEDLAQKIADIAATGQFAPLEEIKKSLPGNLADLAEVSGLGPKRIKLLYQKLKIASVADLAAAAKAGRLRKIQGFGPKTEANILKALGQREVTGKRLRLSVAEQIALPLLNYLKSVPGVEQAVIAGSFRRRRETVGDIDILVTAGNGADPIGRFVAYPEVWDVMAKGTTRATVRLKSGLQVDLRVVPKRSYGAALVYFTGSKAHNIALRAMAMKRGLKFNEYGVFKGARWLAGRTEAEVYAKAGLPYIEPELRENRGELEAAHDKKLPRLVSLADIKGDLHCHTSASDGEATIAEMAEGARRLGYRYLAISDHTEHVGIVHGLDARRLSRQMAEIDRLNAKYRGFRLLKSAEVDILADGKLAIDPGIARELDLVVASIHTKFDLPAQTQTERLLRAMDDRCVTFIGHPTGRLLGAREPYAVDMQRLMRGAIERGCYLEINAQPTRLDLNDVHCRMAKDLGLKLAIATDAHTVETLGFMRFGIDQARRGWIAPADILNTRDLPALLKAFKR
jgi:DNA polymerase (family 10)